MKQTVLLPIGILIALVLVTLAGCAAPGVDSGAGAPTMTAVPLPTDLVQRLTATASSGLVAVARPTESSIPKVTAPATPSPAHTASQPSPTAITAARSKPSPSPTAIATDSATRLSSSTVTAINTAIPSTRSTQSGPRPTPTAEFTGKLVFQTTIGNAFYTINADGSGLRRITDGVDPTWSPDGKRIAFTRWRDPRGVWVVDSNGEEWRAFDYSSARWPSWSPDGQQILFSLQKGGRLEDKEKCFFGFCFTVGQYPHWRLGIVRAEGSGFYEPPSPERSLAPSWSPDGSRIVYSDGHGLRVQSPDGTYSVSITDSAWDASPAWSPDGGRVAFMRLLHDHQEVFVVGAEGRGLVQLTKTPVRPDGSPGSSTAPAWSPDGRLIAFLSDRRGRWEIWVMRADGSQQKPMFVSALDGLTLEYGSVAERAISWTGPSSKFSPPAQTPRPTATPIQRPKAGAGTYDAPVLLSPENGQIFSNQETVTLEWRSVGSLAADEYYVPFVSYLNLGELWEDDTPWLKDTSWTLSEHRYLLDLADKGALRWSVRVMRQTGKSAEGEPQGVPLSPMSEVRELIWQVSSPAAPGATPPIPKP